MPFLLRRRVDTNANWTSVNPIIPDRQFALTKDAGGTGIPLLKIGDGINNWNDLPYLSKRNNLEATANPTTSNNATEFYSVGSGWINTTTKEKFILTSFSGSDAIWQPIGELIAELHQIQDVPEYPDDGYEYVLTELNGVLSWELPSGGGGGGSQTLAQTLVLGDETDGNDIVFTDGDAADHSAAGTNQNILILPGLGYFRHVSAGIFKLKLTELNIYDNFDVVSYQFNSNGTLGVGSINKDGAIAIYDGYSGYSFLIDTPDITDNRALILPDGDIDFSATSAEDGYVLTWDDALGLWEAKESAGGIPDAPSDGEIYGRQDGDWVEITGTGDGVVTGGYLYGTDLILERSESLPDVEIDLADLNNGVMNPLYEIVVTGVASAGYDPYETTLSNSQITDSGALPVEAWVDGIQTNGATQIWVNATPLLKTDYVLQSDGGGGYEIILTTDFPIETTDIVFLRVNHNALINSESIPVWGTIAGYIENQDDLIELLDGYVTEAPADGTIYGRQDEAWVEVGGGGDFIPLSGTEVGSPLTGAIEIGEYIGNILHYTIGVDPGYIALFAEENIYQFAHNNGTFGKFFNIGGQIDLFEIDGTSPTFKGIVGSAYYGANYTDNTYVQKKYVDDAIDLVNDSKFKGVYLTLEALELAYPISEAGAYADVDAGVGSDTVRYAYDASDEAWVVIGAGTPLTATQVKTLYESNADTNAFTDAEKAKVATAIQADGSVDFTAPQTGVDAIDQKHLVTLSQLEAATGQVPCTESEWNTITQNSDFYKDISSSDNGTWIITGKSDGSILRTTDNGLNWVTIFPYEDAPLNWDKVTTDNNGTWILNSGFGGFFIILKSTDNGLNWTEIYDDTTILTSPAAIATDENGVWVGVGNSATQGIMRSTDDGDNWTPIAPPENFQWVDVKTDKNGVWIAVASTGIDYRGMRSFDNGLTWAIIPDFPQYEWRCLDTDGNGVWIAAAHSDSFSTNKIVRSDDNGLTWNLVTAPSMGRALGIATNKKGGWKIVSTQGASGILISEDNGLTWSFEGFYNPLSFIGVNKNGTWIGGGGFSDVLIKYTNCPPKPVLEDGSIPFTEPQTGVEGIDPNHLATVSQITELLNKSQSFIIFISPLDEDATIGVSSAYWDAPYNFKITEVIGACQTAPTGTNIEIDIMKNSVSILTTEITIEATEINSLIATTQPVISDDELTKGNRLTFEINQIGSIVAGQGIQIQIIGYSI